MKCFTKINENDRNNIFAKFYSLKTKDEQDIYLQGLIEKRSVGRRRKKTTENEEIKKSCTYIHFVLVGNTRVRVCQKAFLSLNGISKKRVQRIKILLSNNETPRDKRGHNPKVHAVPEESNILIRQHVESFPLKQTHYSGKPMSYLDARLNVKLMYQLFKEKHPGSSIKYDYYLKYFREHFNYRFGRPQVDTCCQCEELGVKVKSSSLGDAAKRTAAAELIVHKRRAKKFYQYLKNAETRCKTNENVLALSFDYMQNLHLPETPVQDLFYLTQLTVNVFNIHNFKTGESFFYIYHEGNGNKGPNEVFFFLLHYIKNYVPDNVEELLLFCDNCPGQNKNNTVIRMCMALVETRFKKVEQIYPIRGHSFLPCDRDFGTVKKLLRRFDRIFSVHEFTRLIITSSASRKFTVMEVEKNDIWDFKNWWTKFYKKNIVSLETSKKGIPRRQQQNFSVSQFHHFRHDASKPGYVSASPFIDSPFNKHTFYLKMPNTGIVRWPSNNAYQSKIPIKETKVNHIKLVMKYIPDKHKPFYNDIVNWPTKT